MISRRRFKSALVILFVFLILNMRPALFGQQFGGIYIPLLLAGLVVVYLALGYPVVIARSKLVLLGLTAVFVAWIFFQILFMDPENLYTGLVVVVTTLIVAIGCCLLITNSDTELVLKTIIATVSFLSVSQLITYILFFLGAQGYAQIAQVDLQGYEGETLLKWFFPFTFTYHFAVVAGYAIDRAVGLFREPGLYQMFIVISYFGLDFIQLGRKMLLRGLLLFALLTTFSTAGYAVFLGCLIYRNVFARSDRWFPRFVMVMALGVLLVAFAFLPVWGLSDKVLRNQGRFFFPLISWELLLQQPLSGYSITKDVSVFAGPEFSVNAGVNLLTSLHMLGLFGLSLYAGLVLYAIRRHYNRHTLVLWLPVFGTLLLAQPLYEKAFTFFMLFLFTRDLRPLTEDMKHTYQAMSEPLRVRLAKLSEPVRWSC